MADNVVGNGGRWMTYQEVADFLDVSLEAAKRRAFRGQWPRRLHNDDARVRVLVPPDVRRADPNVSRNDPPAVAPSPTPEGATVPPNVAEALAALVADRDRLQVELSQTRAAMGRQENAHRAELQRQAEAHQAELARMQDALHAARMEGAVRRGELRRLDEKVQILTADLDRLRGAEAEAAERRGEVSRLEADLARALADLRTAEAKRDEAHVGQHEAEIEAAAHQARLQAVEEMVVLLRGDLERVRQDHRAEVERLQVARQQASARSPGLWASFNERLRAFLAPPKAPP